jgi:hypothetical protein
MMRQMKMAIEVSLEGVCTVKDGDVVSIEGGLNDKC